VVASGLRLRLPGPGGIGGGLLGWLLAHGAGTVGGGILAALLGVIGLGLLAGVLSRDGLHRLAARLRPPVEEPPRVKQVRHPRAKGALTSSLRAEAASQDEPQAPAPSGALAPERVVEARSVEARVVEAPRRREAVGPWRLPDPGLLARGARTEIDRADLERRGTVLESSLASHGVAVHVTGMTVGPTVTRYELELGEGVKVARVLALQRDIAYAMAAADVRILAPIPGRRAIGIEVPNRVREVVTLGDVLASSAMERATGVLEVPLGKDIAGQTAVFDLAAMPHVLVAGSTGAGKSSLLNSLLTSLLLRTTPTELRLILVDPKRVEMSQYAGLPHLLTSVVVDPKKAAMALAWAVEEMERRYQILAHWGVRDIVGYRELVALARESGEADEEPPEELPYILVMIDELNDLMMAAPRDVEDSICRIAQKARAVGVHLLISKKKKNI
jgi:S-DNA-T family DNA segregation ATPase FtsK/SpoIIIE